MKVALPARAKLNLDLKVIGRRGDGFHDIETHMQSIALHDLLEAAPSKRTSFEADGLSVPAAADNIVVKALAAIQAAVGRELPTQFHLRKLIPPGAGLGGASSDAAAALRAVKMIHGLDVNLAEIAGAVGADVPFFLTGGCALAEGARLVRDRLAGYRTLDRKRLRCVGRDQRRAAERSAARRRASGRPRQRLRGTARS